MKEQQQKHKMSRLVVTPDLNEEEQKRFISYIVEYSGIYACSHQMKNFPVNEWIQVQLEIAENCAQCLTKYTDAALQWLQGKAQMFDHNVLRYLTSFSVNFPRNTFTGFSVGCEWSGFRLDRYVIHNGKQCEDTIYVDNKAIKWASISDAEFDRILQNQTQQEQTQQKQTQQTQQEQTQQQITK